MLSDFAAFILLVLDILMPRFIRSRLLIDYGHQLPIMFSEIGWF